MRWGDCGNTGPRSLSSLVTLDISDNIITDLDLTSLTKLSCVSLAQITMTTLNQVFLKGVPRHVADIRISGAPNLAAIETGAFDGFQHLRNITISNNPQLVKLSPDLLHSTDQMLSINMTNNSIKWLDPATFPWSGVNQLLLDGNPLHCDCELAWLVETLLHVPYHSVTCKTPALVSGINITQYNELQKCASLETWHIMLIATCSATLLLVILVASFSLYHCRRPKNGCVRVQDLSNPSYLVRSYADGSKADEMTTLYWDWNSAYKQSGPNSDQEQPVYASCNSDEGSQQSGSMSQRTLRLQRQPETLRYSTLKCTKPYYDPEYMLGPTHQYPLQHLPVYSTIINPQTTKTLNKQKLVSSNKLWRALSQKKLRDDHEDEPDQVYCVQSQLGPGKGQ